MPDDRGLVDNVFNLKKEEKKKKPSPIIVVEKEILKSKAWLELGGVATQIYLLFLIRRKVEKIGKKGHERTFFPNSQELEFSYKEAKAKFDITQPRFIRAIDSLIENGFLDIVKPGGALFREKTLYGLSERWKKYGTSEFKENSRTKRLAEYGHCRKKKEKK